MKGVRWIHPLILICVNPVLLMDHSYRHNKHDVHFAGFFPTSLGYMETSIGQGVMPAVKLAIRHVNKSPVVLPHNRIRMHWNNTAVSINHTWAGNFLNMDIEINARSELKTCGYRDQCLISFFVNITINKLEWCTQSLEQPTRSRKIRNFARPLVRLVGIH